MQAGHPVAYFDGPGGTQVPRSVAAAMDDYLFHHNANTHWRYPTSEETDALIASARETLAVFLNGRADEIVFGQNMTSLTFHLARALGRGWSKGDEVVVTELDHHGNIAPWRALEKDCGITVRTVKMRTEDGRLDWSSLEAAITPRTKLLAIGAASNALGTITDVAAATKLAHDAGALAFVDAVHYAPHVLVDVQEIGCDFLGCSAYKFYGPHIGVLWGKRAAHRVARRAASRAGAAGIARATRDGNAEPRGHRRRGGRRRFSRVARVRPRAIARGASRCARRSASSTRAATRCSARCGTGSPRSTA